MTSLFQKTIHGGVMLQKHSVPAVWTLAVGPIGIQNSMPALPVAIPVAVVLLMVRLLTTK
jgi:hypothetical protein